MCNLSEGIERKGIEKGIEKGRKKGIEEGIVASIINVMDNLKLSIEDAIVAVGVPESERTDYMATIVGLAK